MTASRGHGTFPWWVAGTSITATWFATDALRGRSAPPQNLDRIRYHERHRLIHSSAREEWEWAPKHDVVSMTAGMIRELSSRQP